MRGPALLTVSQLRAAYGRAQVLFGIDIEVGAGEVVALMGRNGAGKSTTLKSIMGLIPGATGTIRFDGHLVNGLEAFQIARLGMGYVPEERRIFTELTVLENLEVGRQAPRAERPWGSLPGREPDDDDHDIRLGWTNADRTDRQG